MKLVRRLCPWGRDECVTNEPQRKSAGRLHILLLKRNYYLKVPLLLISIIIIIWWIWLSMCNQMVTSEIISRVCQMIYVKKKKKNEKECNIRFKKSTPNREFLHLIIHDCEFLERLQNLWYRSTHSCPNI